MEASLNAHRECNKPKYDKVLYELKIRYSTVGIKKNEWNEGIFKLKVNWTRITMRKLKRVQKRQ